MVLRAIRRVWSAARGAFKITPNKTIALGITLLLLAQGAHIGFDLYNQERLQYDLATCDFQQKFMANQALQNMVEFQSQIFQCSGELEACMGYTDFYHQCCQNANNGKGFEYKTLPELFKERQ